MQKRGQEESLHLISGNHFCFACCKGGSFNIITSRGIGYNWTGLAPTQP